MPFVADQHETPENGTLTKTSKQVRTKKANGTKTGYFRKEKPNLMEHRISRQKKEQIIATVERKERRRNRLFVQMRSSENPTTGFAFTCLCMKHAQKLFSDPESNNAVRYGHRDSKIVYDEPLPTRSPF